MVRAEQDELTRLAATVRDAFGGVDAWINNAGADVLTGSGAALSRLEKPMFTRSGRIPPAAPRWRAEPRPPSIMRIVEIRESTRPISSSIRNSYIDFSKMTLSLVAVVTDVVRDGKPVIGYGFNSNGRYGQGALMRERFIPRVLEAAPDTLRDPERDNLDPHRVWAAMMANEKPGGHGERSVAVGTIDMAVWDAVAKIERQPLHRLLAQRYGHGQSADPRVFVYAAGGYYWPGQGLEGLTREMQGYLDRGYSVVKKKIGGATLAEDCQRIEAVLKLLGPGQRLAVDANGRLENLAELDEVIATGVPRILLDNFTTHDIREAVTRVNGRAKIEVSGGVTLDRIPELATTGADFVSVGALTHSAPAADLSFELEPA